MSRGRKPLIKKRKVLNRQQGKDILETVLAHVNNNLEIQKSLIRQVKVGTKEIEAKLDSGAQVPIIGKELVNSLGLELRIFDRE